MNMQEIKKFAKKFWHFLWYDDSMLSWLANIAVAFLLIKFVIYPGFGLLFGTNYPIVAVVSGSMEHDGTFDDWWGSQAICENKFICTQGEFYEKYGITYDQFQTFDFEDGFNTGDIMVLFGKDPDEIEVGDIIVFRSASGEPIIHRVINTTIYKEKYIYQTKGDHNTNPINSPSLNEYRVYNELLLGKAVLRIPYLGWVKFSSLNSFRGLAESLYRKNKAKLFIMSNICNF